jgi:regulator of protease activity HflC (stomatin/prohibitin superfamily)
MGEGKFSKLIRRSIIGSVLILAAVILWPVSCVPANARGLRYTFSAAGEEILEPGIQFHLPIVQRIKQWSVVPSDYDVTIDISDNGAISKDNQIIGARVVVYWRYDESKLVKIAREWTDDRIEQMLRVNTITAVKTVVGTYTIFDLAPNQVKISDEILARIKQLQLNSEMPIIVSQANVTNFDWSKEFDAQINMTMAAAQKVREAEQQANIAEQEQRKLTITAKAEADAAVAKAEGEKEAARLHADALREEGQGVADYNRLISQNMEIEFRKLQLEIDKIKAEKWDGHYVPNIMPMLPNGAIVNIPNSAQH